MNKRGKRVKDKVKEIVETVEEHVEGDLFEELEDHRSWLRVETMEKLLRRLIELDSDLEGSCGKLVESLRKGSLKRGEGAEFELACKVLEAVFVYGGGDEDLEAAWESVKHGLLRRATPQALECLGMACFVVSEDVFECLEVMKQLEKYLTRKNCSSDAQRVAAIHGWSLIATTLPSRTLLNHVVGENSGKAGLAMRRVAVGRDRGGSDSRIAATEALRIVMEAEDDLSSDEEEDERGSDADDAGENGTHAFSQSDSQTSSIPTLLSSSPQILTMSSVHTALENILHESTSSTKHVPKKDRQWRKELASIADTDRATKHEDVLHQEETVEIRGYCAIVRMDAFRRLLGSRLRDHLRSNVLLREVFDLDAAPQLPRSRKDYDPTDAIRSMQRKSRSKGGRQDRLIKTQEGEAFGSSPD